MKRIVFTFSLLFAALACGGAEAFNSAFISEILAANQRGITDEDGDRVGWIEIHNNAHAAINFHGWFLTDTPTNLTKWRFPGVVLLPDKYLLVLASGKGRTNDLTRLHASFTLQAGGGFLALVDPKTNVVSQLSYGAQRDDQSFASVRGEPARRGFMAPTPGRPNASAGRGFAPSVKFSHASFTFTEPFELKLSCSATGAVIRFTTDGTFPTSNSAIYAGPINITNTARLQARAYLADALPGPPGSAAYIKLATDVHSFTSSVPLLVIDTFTREAPIGPQSIVGHFSWFEPVNGRSSLTNAPSLAAAASFHTRGSTSRDMAQQAFSVEFIDDFGQERNVSPLGLPADSDWVLYAPTPFDPVLIHNPFIYQLSREMGRYAPRTRFVEVFLARSSGSVHTNHYHGLYVLEEKVKIGKHRVNTSKLAADDLKPPDVTGGYLLKFDRLGPGESGFSAGGAAIAFVDPKEQVIGLPQRSAQRDYITRYMEAFEAALNGPKWKDPVEGFRAFIDLDVAIDYHLLEVLSGNVDSLVLSSYFYKPRNGKIICGPHWDFDRALGSTEGRDADPRNWNTGPFFSGTWWPRLLRDPDAWQRWVDRWQELRASQIALGHLFELIDRLAAEIRDAQPREYQKWNFQPRGGSYQSEIQLMKQWLSNRVEFIDEQLTAQPVLSRSNATITLRAQTNATIYYTLDGSDPRRAQGAVSSNALVYSAGVPLSPGVTITARAYDTNRLQTGGPPRSTPWSSALTTNVSLTR